MGLWRSLNLWWAINSVHPEVRYWVKRWVVMYFFFFGQLTEEDISHIPATRISTTIMPPIWGEEITWFNRERMLNIDHISCEWWKKVVDMTWLTSRTTTWVTSHYYQLSATWFHGSPSFGCAALGNWRSGKLAFAGRLLGLGEIAGYVTPGHGYTLLQPTCTLSIIRLISWRVTMKTILSCVIWTIPRSYLWA